MPVASDATPLGRLELDGPAAEPELVGEIRRGNWGYEIGENVPFVSVDDVAVGTADPYETPSVKIKLQEAEIKTHILRNTRPNHRTTTLQRPTSHRTIHIPDFSRGPRM